MPTSATLTLKIEPELKDHLDRLAKSTNQSQSFLATEAIHYFIRSNACQVEAIKDAVKQADNGGPFVPHEEVSSWVDSWGTTNEQPRPKATEL